MKTIISLLLFLGVLATLGGSALRAADQPPPLRKGKVLILKNEYTVEGDIERVDDRYCVRNKDGEIWVPAERALTLVASLPDAYIYLRGRINLDDADERLRLARWCRNNGLHKQALAELHAAAALRPNHAETRRLLHYWQQEAASGVASAPRAAVPRGADATLLAGTRGADATPLAIEVTTESLGLFATHVQPILMNTCARCHATGRGGKFQITQIFENSFGNRRTLESNLAAVLAEIDVNQPEASRLLIKAVSDHAHTGQAPLRDRQAAPYRTLENWVKLTVADNPHLRGNSALTRSLATRDPERPSPEEARAKRGGESQWGAEARPSAASVSSPVARGDKAPTGTGVSSAGGHPTPAAKVAGSPNPAANTAGSPTRGNGVSPVDPYDPEPFNRKTHPEANK